MDKKSVKKSARVKQYEKLFPEGNHSLPQDGIPTDDSLEQPSPLKIVETFVTADCATES